MGLYKKFALVTALLSQLAGCGGGGQEGAAITNSQLALPLTGDLTKAAAITGSEYIAKIVINPGQSTQNEVALVVDRTQSNNQTLKGAVNLPAGAYTLRLDLYASVACSTEPQVKVGEFSSIGVVTVVAGTSTTASFGDIRRQFDNDKDTFDNLAEIIAGSRWCDDRSAPAYPAGRYQIGGSISGIPAGASAKIKLNNFADLTVTGSAFTFPDFLLNNSNYTIRVIQSPTDSVCAVSDTLGNSGSTIGGVINGADIQLTLSCGNVPVAQHSLAISVTGIPTSVTGTLDIREAKLGTLSFNENAKKAFEATLADNATYRLSIDAEPTHVDCQFTGGLTSVSGTMGNTDVTYAVRCAAVPPPAQRTLSVSVTGLTGTISGSLEVKETDLGTLTINANGTQSFEKKMADNSNYSLTLTAQPSNFNCSFPGGTTTASGSIGTADVTVPVTCSAVPQPKVLSIKVIGLSGTVPLAGVLEIQETNAGKVSFTTDETQSFQTKLTEGSSYSLSFTSEPGNYTCTFSGGGVTTTGVVPNADLTVDVNCVTKSLVIFQDTLSRGGMGPKMVVIPAGSFLMGSPDSEPERADNEGPQREVKFERVFAIGQTEVTFNEYDLFANATSQALPDDSGFGRGDLPVINVTWHQAVAYTQWLSEQTGKQYRLPSEAESEYAARAGTTTPFWTGPCINTDQANYDGNFDYNSCGALTGVAFNQAKSVGSFAPSPFGLYDTIGNVLEWVQDCHHANYTGAPTNGSAWEGANGGNCDLRLLRSGSWHVMPARVRSATRDWTSPDSIFNYAGFRIARDL